MKLLVEQSNFNSFSIIEEADKKQLHITGPFIQMDVVNANGRLYPSSYIPDAVEKYIVEKVQTNRAVGELNHPPSPEVNYERACIKINELRREGSNYIGKARVLETVPLGAIVAGLLREGVQIGVSSRALGSLKTDAKGIKIVQPDYHLMTAADVVSDPSAPDALVTAIMESRDWVFENGVLKEDETKKRVNDAVLEHGLNATTLKRLFEEVTIMLQTHRTK